MSELNRRQFVKASAAAGVSLVVLGSQGLAFAARPAPASGTIDIGTPGDYPADGVFDKFLKTHKLLVVRGGDRIVAISARCTHKGAALAIKEGKIRCPSHGSTFTEQGVPASGPAKAALFRYGITLNDQGRLIVDRSRQFGQRQWDDAGAFISTKSAS